MTSENLSRPIARWPIPDSLRNDPMVTQAENLVSRHASGDLDSILDAYVIYSDAASVERDFTNLFNVLAPFRLKGKGMEIGAGVSIFSSMACKYYPEVKSIHAIEVVAGVVERLRPLVLEHFLGDDADRVIDVIGSFDDIALDDGSLDFCIENSSLHHSMDLPKTLREINRKLGKGGHLLIVDRAHNNRMPERQRRGMLDLVYSTEVMDHYGFKGEKLTRRDNGEHEIKLCEWERDIRASGFEVERHVELRSHGLAKLVRALKLSVPYFLRQWLNISPTYTYPHPGEVSWLVKCLLGFGNRDSVFKKGHRDYTVFLARKVAEAPPKRQPRHQVTRPTV